LQQKNNNKFKRFLEKKSKITYFSTQTFSMLNLIYPGLGFLGVKKLFFWKIISGFGSWSKFTKSLETCALRGFIYFWAERVSPKTTSTAVTGLINRERSYNNNIFDSFKKSTFRSEAQCSIINFTLIFYGELDFIFAILRFFFNFKYFKILFFSYICFIFYFLNFKIFNHIFQKKFYLNLFHLCFSKF